MWLVDRGLELIGAAAVRKGFKENIRKFSYGNKSVKF